MATSSKQTFHKNLECPVCLRFLKEPKILTCSHTFCKGCLEKILESRRIKDVLLCPTCRGKTSVPGGDVGRLQSNIIVRSLVEDVETHGHSDCNQGDTSLQRTWNKCQKHPNYDEECFCLDCNKYVCFKCGLLEHTINAHTTLEASAYETAQKNNVKELASKADAKICEVDKYVRFVAGHRKRVHNVQEQLNDEIDESFEESVQKLKKRKKELKNEVKHGQLGNLKTSLRDLEKSGREQIDEIKTARDLVKNGLNFPLQTGALTSHNVTCQQLEEILSPIGPDEELPTRTAEEGERIFFRSQGSDGLQLGKLIIRQKKSKWILRTENPLPDLCLVTGMAISPNNEMAVGTFSKGIFIYSSEGAIQSTVLKSVRVNALHFMPDTGYVIRGEKKNIFLYTDLSEKLVTFKTMADRGSPICSLTVGKDGLIFVGYNECKTIQVFKPEDGKAIREITCNGFKPWQMFAMTSSQAIVVKNGVTKVHVINDVSGAIIHSIGKYGDGEPYPAVCQDDSVIIAWVNRDQGLVSIVQYTKELKYIKNILTDFKILKGPYFRCYLQEFKTGEIAFCAKDRLYIFHETLE